MDKIFDSLLKRNEGNYCGQRKINHVWRFADNSKFGNDSDEFLQIDQTICSDICCHCMNENKVKRPRIDQ